MKKNTMKLILILCSILALVLIIFIYMKSQKLPLKNEVIVVEYGNKLNINKNEILDTDNQAVIDSIVLDTSTIVNENGKDYPKIGKYTISFTYNYYYTSKIGKQNIEIVDKPTPEVDKQTSEIEEKSTPYTIKSPTVVANILIVNKKHPLPSNYFNNNTSEAQSQIKKMINDMRSNGYDIATNYSGYRSFQYQKKLYDNYVKNHGQNKADTYSARPGYSEHQTGLSFDLLHQNGSLVEKTNEAAWIAKNAHKYGFIVRYQNGKESITGYIAEPWHLRYIGDKATAIYNSGLCLEEYLNVTGGNY